MGLSPASPGRRCWEHIEKLSSAEACQFNNSAHCSYCTVGSLTQQKELLFFFRFLLNPPGQFKPCGYFFPLGESLCEDFLFLTVHSVKPFFFIYCLLLENVGAEHKAFFAGQWMNSWPEHLTFECSFRKRCPSGGKSEWARLYHLSPCELTTGVGIFSGLSCLSSVQMNLPSLFCRQINQINILLKIARSHPSYAYIIELLVPSKCNKPYWQFQISTSLLFYFERIFFCVCVVVVIFSFWTYFQHALLGSVLPPEHVLFAGKTLTCCYVFLLRSLLRELRKDVDMVLMSLFRLCFWGKAILFPYVWNENMKQKQCFFHM